MECFYHLQDVPQLYYSFGSCLSSISGKLQKPILPEYSFQCIVHYFRKSFTCGICTLWLKDLKLREIYELHVQILFQPLIFGRFLPPSSEVMLPSLSVLRIVCLHFTFFSEDTMDDSFSKCRNHIPRVQEMTSQLPKAAKTVAGIRTLLYVS